MKAAILTLALLLTGTSAAQWTKIEQTEAEIALAACTALADQAWARANDDSVWVSRKTIIKSCMATKGYALPPKKKAVIVCTTNLTGIESCDVQVTPRKAAKKPAMKARKKAAIVYVIRCEGCKSTTPNPQRTPVTKIAIFPFDSDSSSCLGRNRPTQEEIASTLRTVIQNNDSLRLAYSYYDKSPDDPLRNNVDQLWLGNVSKRPNTAFLYQLGQELDVDAVLMSWRAAAGVGYCTDRMPPYPIELYLADVKSQYMLSVEGDEARLKGMTEQFFAHFLKGPAKRSAAANKR